MTRSTRIACVVATLAVATTGVRLLAAGPPQVQLDRIVSRVNGRAITASDVRQARACRLVDDVSSDAAVQHAIENRLLILSEMARVQPVAPPSDAEIAARRGAWASRAGADASALMARNGLSEADLLAWIRDDLRIQAYLARQFGTLPEGDRARASDDWLNRLRQRAELR